MKVKKCNKQNFSRKRKRKWNSLIPKKTRKCNSVGSSISASIPCQQSCSARKLSVPCDSINNTSTEADGDDENDF